MHRYQVRERQQISIHAPTKGATNFFSLIARNTPFQSTLPRKERLMSEGVTLPSISFQSTLPRKERRGCPPAICVHCIISIHAPTKGATSSAHQCVTVLAISIHAPTKGATTVRIYDFFDIDISIHAPTKGATATANSASKDLKFQSTLPRKERLLVRSGFRLSRDFNPRSHERSDRDL